MKLNDTIINKVTGKTSAFQQNINKHLNDRHFIETRPSPITNVSCQLIFLFRQKMYHVLYTVIFLQNLSVVNKTSSPICVFKCPYKIQETLILLLHLSHVISVISPQNNMHWLIYCYFTGNVSIIVKKRCLHYQFDLFTFFLFITVMHYWYVAIFYLYVLISI